MQFLSKISTSSSPSAVHVVNYIFIFALISMRIVSEQIYTRRWKKTVSIRSWRRLHQKCF